MAFLRQLALALKPCLFLPGEYIIHKGDTDFGMFFLYNGEVRYKHFPKHT
jgi:CRP-like cAMP-binding protein